MELKGHSGNRDKGKDLKERKGVYLIKTYYMHMQLLNKIFQVLESLKQKNMLIFLQNPKRSHVPNEYYTQISAEY